MNLSIDAPQKMSLGSCGYVGLGGQHVPVIGPGFCFLGPYIQQGRKSEPRHFVDGPPCLVS